MRIVINHIFMSIYVLNLVNPSIATSSHQVFSMLVMYCSMPLACIWMHQKKKKNRWKRNLNLKSLSISELTGWYHVVVCVMSIMLK